jgi:hypothetical protein
MHNLSLFRKWVYYYEGVYGRNDNAHSKLQDLVEANGHLHAPAVFTSWSGSQHRSRPPYIA